MRLANIDELRKDIVERGTQLSGCYSASTARYMDRMLAHVLDAVDHAPTIDAVPVVRCKDCRHRYITGDTTHYYVCDFMDAEYNDNGYCHHRERKDDESVDS